MSSIEEVMHLQIPLQELSDATNGFSKSNLIGIGGYGEVYHGKSVKHGNIAIKILDPRNGQGDPEFRTEIALLSVYKHENIVSLVGFCDEGEKKILVYRYETNGSLDKHLRNINLTWIQRLKICLDAARGLQYLHDDVGAEHRVLHRDVKSANILLDENWRAKIADFGLSKIGPANMPSTFLISNVCGTIGYIDPDYFNTGYLTQKSDVYSFGVVLFEVLCGRLARDRRYKDERQFLTNLIKIHWKRSRTFNEIIYLETQKQINRASLLAFSTIAYQCLMSANERPTMKKVVEQLQKALDNQLVRGGGYMQFPLCTNSKQLDRSLVRRPSWKVDVYLSLENDYSCKTFVDNLYLALVRRQVIMYRNTKRYYPEKRKRSRVELIEESRIVIIIFTPNYACSSWCLDELEFIMQIDDRKGQTVIPVFYGVEPSEVISLTGSYGEALAIHESKHDTVESWREALVNVAHLISPLDAGCDMANGNESEHIQKLVVRVLNTLLGSTQHSEDKCGVWGSGKSTLVSSVYDEISHEFEGCCFVKDVRARSRRDGLKTLQEEILSNVLKLEVTLTSLEQGIDMMKTRLCKNSVLIVLDDVDHADHIEMLVGSENWFGNGSRIIFTTRNRDLVNARSSLAHTVRMLDDEEAVELFSRRAFGKNKPSQGFEEVSRDIVSKFGGHPSALISLGSLLHDRDMSDWMSILDRLVGRSVDEILWKFETPDDGLARNYFPRFLT
ncbi:hypothetical protein SSX86_017499 [Deinandra increscens subsp. villosa]|uniref:Uncharacterized protein n=1 Tax=Deinandra increscens subsp. villosa TaxID=3103831 RepID=A0AAP0GUB3_9ASTR